MDTCRGPVETGARIFRTLNVRNDRYPKKKATDPQALVYGIRAVAEAITSGKEIDRLFIQQGLKSELFSELRKLINEREIQFQYVPFEKIDRLVGNRNHQGVAAFLSPVSFQHIEDILPSIFENGETPLILVLDRVTDVRNFGAIARTAVCAGVHAIVVPSRGAAQVNADAVKTSAGALHSIPVCREDNLKETIEYLKNSGLKIAACTEKTDTLIYNAELDGPLAIIMGSEEDGISGEYLKRADVLVKIPMSGSIASLNVSVAAGIILFEAVRKRMKNN
ncbi:MAG: 23S rRNA (guanosine2251-2'-O)-methyltransferase [Bacteroidetes bacterium]|nr:MAG: 23S rRNA (guanosine2251-2'-O)-methyltransferase [Bacteroidota bacterium]